MWEYRVRATSATDGNSAWSDVSRASSPKTVWPIDDGDHDILHNFGTPLDFGFTPYRYFHEGVDISASCAQVNAARGGIITRKENGAGGWVDVQVDVGGGLTETDSYLHISNRTALGVNDPIAPGEMAGVVSTTHFNKAVEADHLHWGDTTKNKLSIFSGNSDRDPNLQEPVVSDINGDNKDFYVVNAAANDHNNPREPAWGNVDFIIDAYDDMAANLNLMSSPYSIGYWIQSIVPEGTDVRDSTTPYRLIEFDFGLHGTSAAHPLENAVVYWNLSADIQGIDTWQTCLSWILTNTKGTDGTVANVDAGQFWRTDARKGTGAEPNGSDAQRARENQDATFPDGTYLVHVILDDLVHSKDNVRSVLVDNSKPYVRKVTVYSGLRIVYQAQWIWDSGAAQLAIQPADFNTAAAFTALRTQDITVEVEFSEPMQTASISSILPLGVTPNLISTQPSNARTIWRGLISNLDIADDGTDDGDHIITINGTDLAGNQLLQINNRNDMVANHHNRNAAGVMQGTTGTDNIHGFKIGPLEGVIPVTAIFMKQNAADPAAPAIADKALALQQALNNYYNEVSYGEISFAITGHGWYQLSNPLDWYYTNPQSPLIDLVQEAITSAEAGGADIANSSYVLIITDENNNRDEWSTNGAWPYNITAAPGWKLIASGVLNLNSSDARVSNLIGRIVGLIDLFAYPEVTVSRPFVGPWSHMSDKDNEVHFMGWEKWRVGWLDESGTATGKTVERVAKPPVASPIVNQTYILSPLDDNNDATKTVAIEIGDRLYYTAEYRRQQNFDTDLPDSGVLIVKTNDFINQGEGPAIVQESPVTATDLSDATFNLNAPRDVFDDVGSGVNIEVTSINANQAEIRLNYQIPPLENDVFVSPHTNRWKAEDIWVDAPDLAGNFEADPLTVKDTNEKPVVGELNKVIARVRNQGHADATNFEVHLEIREPWGAGGPWRSLNVETVPLLQGQDNNPNDHYLIIGDWTPVGDIHSCVQVTVHGVANDINSENNWTQENISEFVTTAGSPYSPIVSRFEVENPYNENILVFFKLDGLPPSWSYILTPNRLEIHPNGVGSAQVTIQPNEASPLCTSEEITISAFTPRVDTLKRLGAITLQTALKNSADISLESWIQCGKTNEKTHAAYSVNNERCVIHAKGCTDPILKNTQIAVVYTDNDGNSQVRYVTTDENGCYYDMQSADGSALWEVQAVLEETDCRAEAKTPKETLLVKEDDITDDCCKPWWCCLLWILFMICLAIFVIILLSMLLKDVTLSKSALV